MSIKSAKVFRVKIEPPVEPFLSTDRLGDRVENALSQGSGTERYGRLWRIGRVDKYDNIIVGKLGFINRPKSSEVWDEEEKDFHEISFTDGSSAVFAVNLDNLNLAIQPTTNVSITGALGAIRSMLSLEGEKWKISPLRKSIEFEKWAQTVEKIVRVKYRLRKPNPHYGDAKSLEDIMESAEAEVVTLEMESEAGLELNSRFLRETQLHTSRGYGEADYVGIREDSDGHKVESRFSTMAGSEEEAIEVKTQDNGEVSNEEIIDISKRPS